LSAKKRDLCILLSCKWTQGAIIVNELIKKIEELLGDEDFEHTVDAVEWTNPEYNHQN